MARFIVGLRTKQLYTELDKIFIMEFNKRKEVIISLVKVSKVIMQGIASYINIMI